MKQTTNSRLVAGIGTLAVAVLLAAMPAQILAQSRDPRPPIALQGPIQHGNEPCIGGTRTDMAPVYNGPHDLKVVQGPFSPTPSGVNVIRAYTADDAREACEKRVSGREVQTTLLVQETQNSEFQIPIVQQILNSRALEAAREQTKKDCAR